VVRFAEGETPDEAAEDAEPTARVEAVAAT